MIEKCLCCGKPISAYPCKFCGYSLMIEDICPCCKGAICQLNKKACKNKHNYMNCNVLRERQAQEEEDV